MSLRTRRAGIVLLVVVGVLGILSVLGVAFLTMARLERKASEQRVNVSKARLLARSGIEDALARLADGQDPDLLESRYGGEDWDASGGPLSPFEAAQEVYQPGTPNTDDCPARQALRPSFFAWDASGKPRRLGVDGRERGFSGAPTPDGSYALRVRRLNGLCLNGGNPSAAPLDGANAVLRRLLGTLALETGLLESDGWNLVDRRPRTPRGWTDWNQVRDAAFNGAQAKLDALAPYVLLRAWADRHVIHPDPKPAMVNQDYACWADIKKVGGAPGLETSGGSVVGRCPVYLGWARHQRPVLIALLKGLSGLTLDERTVRSQFSGDIMGTLRLATLSDPDAASLAGQILASTSDLSTWEHWNAFSDSLTVSGATPEEIQAKRDLLKANFNPNSDLNKFNPNGSLWRSVDKGDLLVYSTEFTPFPIQPIEVSCAGRILDRSGRLLAIRTLSANLDPPSAVRITTQKEFLCENLGNLDLAGDETQPRLPGASPVPPLGISQGSAKTWGHLLTGMAGKGMALQSYPEPCVDPGSGLQITPADYDGNLQLATVETGKNDTYGFPGQLKMLARYNDGLDLDQGGGTLANQTDLKQAPVTNSLLDAALPNTLYPDGCYSEKDRMPSYLSRNNTNGLHGVLGFWFKQNYGDTSALLAGGMRGHELVSLSNAGTVSIPESQYFTVVDVWALKYGFARALASLHEICHETLDDDKEHGFGVPTLPVPHRWHLMTYYWDFQAPDSDSTGEMVLDQGIPGEGEKSLYGWSGNISTLATDITLDDIHGPHRIYLGRYPYDAGYLTDKVGAGADTTIDEFAIWDFGQNESLAKALAAKRHQEGRYYKGAAYRDFTSPAALDEAGSYLSAPLLLPAGSVLRQVHWTWVRPSDPELAGDYAAVELVDRDLSLPRYLWTPALSRSQDAPGWAAGDPHWAPGRTVTTPFRIRALFLRASGSMPPSTPILDSPVLDDLTLLYTPRGGPPAYFWQEE